MVMQATRLSGPQKAKKPEDMQAVFAFKEGPLSGTVKMIDGRICTHSTIQLDDDRYVVNDQLQKDVTQAVLTLLRSENGQTGE